MGSCQCFFFLHPLMGIYHPGNPNIIFFLNVACSTITSSTACDCVLYRVLFLKHEILTHTQWVSYSTHAHTDFWERKNCRIRAQGTPWTFSLLFPTQQLKLFPWISCPEWLDSMSCPHFLMVLLYHQGHLFKSLTWN